MPRKIARDINSVRKHFHIDLPTTSMPKRKYSGRDSTPFFSVRQKRHFQDQLHCDRQEIVVISDDDRDEHSYKRLSNASALCPSPRSEDGNECFRNQSRGGEDGRLSDEVKGIRGQVKTAQHPRDGTVRVEDDFFLDSDEGEERSRSISRSRGSSSAGRQYNNEDSEDSDDVVQQSSAEEADDDYPDDDKERHIPHDRHSELLKSCRYTKKEDNLLLEGVRRYGVGKWKQIEKLFEGQRSNTSFKDRYSYITERKKKPRTGLLSTCS